MSRAKLNYWIDVVMGVAFVLSAVSGLVFLLPVGFLSADTASTLGLSYRLWDQLHIWGSLAMIAGVGGHLLLHTKWIVAMTRKMLVPADPATAGQASGASAGAYTNGLPRRGFLKLGGTVLGISALAAAGFALLGLGSVLGEDEGESIVSPVSDTAESQSTLSSGGRKEPANTQTQMSPEETASQDSVSEPAGAAVPSDDDEPGSGLAAESTSTPTAEPTAVPATEPPAEATEELCVLCPHGLVNDPYPGRCRRYTDRDGDRICDLSVPQPCDV